MMTCSSCTCSPRRPSPHDGRLIMHVLTTAPPPHMMAGSSCMCSPHHRLAQPVRLANGARVLEGRVHCERFDRRRDNQHAISIQSACNQHAISMQSRLMKGTCERFDRRGHALRHALHEVRVARAVGGDGQDPDRDGAIVPEEEALRARRLGHLHATKGALSMQTLVLEEEAAGRAPSRAPAHET